MEAYNLFKTGITFDDFVNQDSDTYKEKTLEISHNINFEDKLIERINKINKQINILICAEIWCPDCMINVPIVEKMRLHNKNVHLSIVKREGNEDFFKKYSHNENVKIPTFVFYSKEFRELGYFIEYPQKIKDIVAKGNQPNLIVAKRKYRKGEYANETLREILTILERS